MSLCLLLSPLHAQDLHITLLNGDCDGDNEVTLFDFGIVVSAMGSVPDDPNWDARADLDGDGEVTLFDFGILVRNFGQVGAEPFDPTLPRLPAPSEGYALQGSVELQDWVGAPQPVRIEASREDDPDQIVYWIEVQSGEPFTLHLPRSGLWWVKVSGAQQSQARHLTGQSAAKRFYGPGDPIQAFFITPREGGAFADAALEDAPIGVSVYAQDYDDVFFQSADGSRTLSNRERNPDPERQGFVSFTTQPISSGEPHRRFQFSASAVFSITLPPPVGRIEQRDEKTTERLLGFDFHYVEPHDRLYTNELIDDSRGQSVFGTWVVPNWFHNRPGHWGAVVPRFNEEYGLRWPIVHWIPMTLEEILEELEVDEETRELLTRLGVIEIIGVFDFMGALGPEPFAEQYRGRIYIFPAAVSRLKVEDAYGLTADGIDLLARAVAHEFAHRDQFLRAWGGFSDDHIRPRGIFLPANRSEGQDDDGDGLSNDYEESAEGQWYGFNSQVRDALYQWWMGRQGCQSGTGLPDSEMYARLYGEWNHYWIGSLDQKDYSVGGRLDY